MNKLPSYVLAGYAGSAFVTREYGVAALALALSFAWTGIVWAWEQRRD